MDWREECVELVQGELLLRTKRNPESNKNKRYLSGQIYSNNKYLYGTFEARIKPNPRFPGVCTAFWAFNKNDDYWKEIDFVEIFNDSSNPNVLTFNTHTFYEQDSGPSREPSHKINRRKVPVDFDVYDYNTYRCEWTDTEIKWYVNDTLLASNVNINMHDSLVVVVSAGIREPLRRSPSVEGFPSEAYVEYIKIKSY
ncbi:MAG: glycoside hydrolase family 16 protein [Candidatus Marinimicrobia bacterium]|nr:glycoside hydrolase family 16 protein [Candidatus Neomarinimicrobiota bacterium]